MSATFTCPRCGLAQEPGVDCPKCGIVFAKYQPDRHRPARGEVPRPVARKPIPARTVIRAAALLAAVVLAALLWVGLRGAGPGPEETFAAWREALAAGDLDAMAALTADAERDNVRRAAESGGLALARAMGPASFEVRGARVDGDKAVLDLYALVEDGGDAKGTVDLVREGRDWRVLKESWAFRMQASALPWHAGSPAVRVVEAGAPERLAGGEDAGDALPGIASRAPGGRRRVARAFGPASGRPAQVIRLEAPGLGGGALAFHPDGRVLFAARYDDMSVRGWRLDTLEALGALPMKHRPVGVAAAPDGSALHTVDAYANLLEWPVRDGVPQPGRTLAETPAHPGTVLASPDGRLLALAGGDNVKGGWIELRDPGTGRVEARAKTPGRLAALAFGADGRFLAAAGHGNRVTVHDLARGEARQYTAAGAPAASEVFDLAFSPDGRLVASAHNDSTVSVWDLSTGRQVLDFFVRDASAMCLAFCPDGSCLATGQGDGTVYLWNPDRGGQIARLPGHAGSVEHLEFGPDGSVLATADREGRVRLWY